MSPPPAPAEPSRRTRWLDRAATVLLAVAVGAVIAAATPALLTAGGVEIPVTAEPSLTGSPLALPHRPPEILAQPDPPELFAPPPSGIFDDDQDTAPHGALGVARWPLTLREQPSLVASVSGEVKAGEMVRVLRIAGDWALVYHGGGEGLVAVGWAKKSEIAIR